MSKVRGKLSRAKTLEKIAREISFVQQLQSCDKVVRLLGCYEDADVVQMVTELCTAGDLRRYVEVGEARCRRCCWCRHALHRAL